MIEYLYRPCNVVDSNDCLAPANGPMSVRTRCFGCGLPVCSACSMMADWYTYGRRLIGFDCLRQNGGAADIEAVYAERAAASGRPVRRF